MAQYKIVYTDDAVNELKRIPKKQVEKIIAKIDKLAINPLSPGIKKLKGKMNLWRMRVGDYRVVYTIENKSLIVEIIRIKHRGEVYDNL